jgi:hypothetical protein
VLVLRLFIFYHDTCKIQEVMEVHVVCVKKYE